MDSPWLHFEAGAVANNEDAFICTFLYDITEANVKPPLSEFQNTKNSKEDIFKLLKTINGQIGKSGSKVLKEANLSISFDTFWPKLKEKLDKTPIATDIDIDPRTDREIIEEILQNTRSLKANRKNPSFLSTEEAKEILDFWIGAYAKVNSLGDTSVALSGHEEKIAKYMSRAPEIVLLFGSQELLKARIKERINDYLPF